MADEERMDPHQWVRTLATALDVEPPTQAEVDDLLSLSGTAAHTAERWVAPVSTWLVARAGVETTDGRGVVERLAAAARDGGGGPTDHAGDAGSVIDASDAGEGGDAGEGEAAR